MKTTGEFEKAGKEMPYQVPDGFFERITGETLLKARQRTEWRRKKLRLRLALGMAASFLLLVVAGITYLNLPPQRPAAVTADSASPGDSPRTNVHDPVVLLPIDTVTGNFPPENSIKPANNNEEHNISLTEVLASLSDEELLMMAACFENDLFMDAQNND